MGFTRTTAFIHALAAAVLGSSKLVEALRNTEVPSNVYNRVRQSFLSNRGRRYGAHAAPGSGANDIQNQIIANAVMKRARKAGRVC